MSCNRPIVCYYADKLNESGKRPLVFSSKLRYRGGDPRYVNHLEISCGKCRGCRADTALMWSIRGYHESTLHQQNSFITLTYDDDHLPSDGKIDKRHLQLFFKRLRRDGTKIRYLACGEYGSHTRRPHYHAIIFGKDWLEGSQMVTDKLYTNKTLVDTWGYGLVSVAPVTMASICYVCGYVNKKTEDTDSFNLMSRRPGIGHRWLDLYSDDIARTGIVSIDGQQYQVPKRYLQWHEEELEHIKKMRAEYAMHRTGYADSLKRFNEQTGREIGLASKQKSKQEKL